MGLTKNLGTCRSGTLTFFFPWKDSTILEQFSLNCYYRSECLLPNPISSLGPPCPMRTSSSSPHLFPYHNPCPPCLTRTSSSSPHFFPYHNPSPGTQILPSHIPPSPTILLIKNFTNFHEFSNSLKELMFVINRDLGLSFPIIHLHRIDDGCKK